jgi:hypothetical protein
MLVALALAPPSYAATAAAGLSTNRPLDEDMLDDEESDSDEETPGTATTTASRTVAKN